MRILHIADLHLGQILYQHYDREDEHAFFFNQLETWLSEYQPDALLVSGDIFDIQQPAAHVWKNFTSFFVGLRKKFPSIHFVIIAGNHDSPSRIQSHSEVWDIAGVSLVGTPPPISTDLSVETMEKFIVRLPSGFIVTLPYMSGERMTIANEILSYVDSLNIGRLPVVITGHLAVSGADYEGHEESIGTLQPINPDLLGSGYDYLALGHIHKPQTINHHSDRATEYVHYSSPVARYSGSVLHVSGDESYPHTASLVDIDRHEGEVFIRQLRIKQLRHFHTLPSEGAPAIENEKEGIKAIESFIKENNHAYIRLRISHSAFLPADFNSKVYNLLSESGRDIRFNPRPIRVSPSADANQTDDSVTDEFDVSELQQMTNPLEFVKRTISDYPDLTIEELETVFREVEAELRKQDAL